MMPVKSKRSEATLNPDLLKSREDLEAALEMFLEINAEIEEKVRLCTKLKRSATQYAIENDIDVVQLRGSYFRLIRRATNSWDATKLAKLVKGKRVTVHGKKIPLWQYITKRVPDPEKIKEAVESGYVKQKDIQEAYVTKDQMPFFQNYQGLADDA
jgi:hypothetical protein